MWHAYIKWRHMVIHSTWYSSVSNILMLKTLPAAKGSRNINAKLDPFSRSFCMEIKNNEKKKITAFAGIIIPIWCYFERDQKYKNYFTLNIVSTNM